MERSLQINYEIIQEDNSIEDMIRDYEQPLKDFEQDIPDFPMLDIGIGAGEETIYYASKGRKIYAVDNEQFVLDLLRKKTKDVDFNITLLHQCFPNISIPEEKVSCIIMSNLLHFLEDYSAIKAGVEQMSNFLVPGGLLLVRVHSLDHPANNPRMDGSIFKHFFTEEEVRNLLDSASFEQIYYSKYSKKFGKKARNHRKKWLSRVWTDDGGSLDDLRFKVWSNQNMSKYEEDCIITIFKKVDK